MSFLDQLPAGTTFLNDGTSRIAFVSNGGGFTAPVYAGLPGAFVNGNETTISSITPTAVIPIAQIAGGPFISGTDVRFVLGSVTNGDSDPDNEFVVIEFNALVNNEIGNRSGTVLSNNYLVQNAATTLFTSPNVDVTVVEPTVTIQKSVLQSSADAGDTVQFVVVVRNESGTDAAPAYDVNVLDVLPASYLLTLGSVQVVVQGAPTTVTNASAGNNLNVTIGTLHPGDAVVVTYTAVVANSVRPNDTLTNTARLTYTSLPGTNGTLIPPGNPTGSTTPGVPGTATGERDGSGAPSTTSLNNYFGSSSAAVTVPTPTVAKSVLDTSVPETQSGQFDPNVVDLTIGEQVTFRLVVTLREGTTTAVLTDNLPFAPGVLEYIRAHVVSIGGNITGSSIPVGGLGIPTDTNGDGIPDLVTFNFGTVVNAPDNVTNADDQIVVEVVARAVDVPANQSGVRMTNGAVLNYQTGTAASSADVEIVEPTLLIDKSANVSMVDAGDIVTYTVVVRHAPGSTGPAFDLSLRDLLLGNLDLVVGSVTSTLGAVTQGNSAGDSAIIVTVPALLLGQTLTVTYRATVTAGALPGQVVPNLAFMPYDSLPGPGGRTDLIFDPAVVQLNSNAVSGTVFVDFANSGVIDPGEPRLPGVTVTLTGTDNLGTPVNLTTTTNLLGFYQFPGLRPGNYLVTETQPPFFVTGFDVPGSSFGVGVPTTGTNQLQAVIPLGSNATGRNFNFAELIPNAIVGIVWRDDNDNGIFELGEPGIPGVTITLAGNDNVGPVLRTTTTDAFGLYFFTGLGPGTYSLIETQPADYIDGQDQLGSLGGTVGQDRFDGIVMTGGSVGFGYNFGELTPSQIFGYVYADINNNGTRDPGEVGIPGTTIQLAGTNDRGEAVNLATVTDADGRYGFGLLRQGTYQIVEVQPAGFLDNYEENLDPLPLPVTVGNDSFSGLVLPLATTRGAFNFGELPPSSIAGLVYVDLNRNGVLDPNEPGIPGVSITLTGTDDRGNPVGPTMLLTDGDGRFRFANLRPGVYQLVEIQPERFVQGVDTPGTAGGIVIAQDVIAGILLPPATDAFAYRFGELRFDRPAPVDPLPPLPPLPVPTVDPDKRAFLTSTAPIVSRPLTERIEPNYAALGTLDNPYVDTTFVATAEGDARGYVRVFDLTGGQERFRLVPFPGNPGGARVAVGDVNGDFVPDIVTAAGPGGGPRVVIYDGVTGTVVADFLAFEETFRGGLNLAIGDLDGNGRADVVVSPDVGGGPRVRIFAGGDPNRILADFWALDDENFRGGVRPALGDVDGDGVPDLVVGAGIGGGPCISVWNGATVLAGNPLRFFDDFFAFESSLRNGVYVTVGDVDGDGRADILTGAGPGGSQRVLGFDGANLFAGVRTPAVDFLVGSPDDRGGIPLRVVDLDGDGRTELFAVSGAGSAPIARFLDPRTASVIDEFAADWLEYRGGIFVG